MALDAVLVGCGNRGSVHADALAASDRFDLVGVCDLDAERARAVAADHGDPAVYADLDAALSDAPAHVSVATPATVRRPVIEAALANDPDSVLFEKPVATTFEEVQAIAAAVDGADARTTVCHQHVYGDELQALGRWLEEDQIGDPERLVGTTKLGLFEHGTHFVHALNWLLDAVPERVRAHAEWGEHPFFDDWHADVEPVDALVELAYPGNRRAVLHFGPDAPDVPVHDDAFWLEYRLDVVGTDGRATFVLGDHAELRTDDGTERVEVEGFDVDGAATRRCYDRLADCLAGDRESHPSDFRSALDAHRVLEAALRSADESRAVDLESV